MQALVDAWERAPAHPPFEELVIGPWLRVRLTSAGPFHELEVVVGVPAVGFAYCLGWDLPEAARRVVESLGREPRRVLEAVLALEERRRQL